MELLGHSQMRTTMDIYSHVMPALAREAADRMGALLLTGKGRQTATTTATRNEIGPGLSDESPGPQGGAEGTRTPDPHTASVVRYQLRHSPLLPERWYMLAGTHCRVGGSACSRRRPGGYGAGRAADHEQAGPVGFVPAGDAGGAAGGRRRGARVERDRGAADA